MSIIHVNQIRNQLEKLFRGSVDLQDVSHAGAEHQERFFLTRSLAAYVVYHLAAAEPPEAASSVTDAGDDNGVDAVHYSEQNRRLYIVQSKWIGDGVGEPENGDVKKFMAGVRDLFNLRFDRFNSKVQAKQGAITRALGDPNTKYEIVLAHTGASNLAVHSRRDFDDLAAEMNDVSEVLVVTVLNQAGLHSTLAASIGGEPISLQIGLKSWGRIEGLHEAFYGQVSGEQVVNWWTTYRSRLFARNLRGVLGETEVNQEMRRTLDASPGLFWYFNNGVTIVARRANRAMLGGGGSDFATFHCEDVSVVNGAQTVGSVGKFGEANPTSLSDVSVLVRIIVRGEDQHFGEDVTRTNNRQNRIENRDFVALDPEQARIRTELAIDGIEYQLVRSETVSRSGNAFDLVEATTALACASPNVRLAVQLKREIGRLWDDISRSPYREIFNPSVSGLFLWRCVQVQRRIDAVLEALSRPPTTWRNQTTSIHGNRLISALVFGSLPSVRFRDPGFDLDSVAGIAAVDRLVHLAVAAVNGLLDAHYPNSIVPTLFKNQRKCEHLFQEARGQIH